jgi:hypothetical protein
MFKRKHVPIEEVEEIVDQAIAEKADYIGVCYFASRGGRIVCIGLSPTVEWKKKEDLVKFITDCENAPSFRSWAEIRPLHYP